MNTQDKILVFRNDTWNPLFYANIGKLDQDAHFKTPHIVEQKIKEKLRKFLSTTTKNFEIGYVSFENDTNLKGKITVVMSKEGMNWPVRYWFTELEVI